MTLTHVDTLLRWSWQDSEAEQSVQFEETSVKLQSACDTVNENHLQPEVTVWNRINTHLMANIKAN